MGDNSHDTAALRREISRLQGEIAAIRSAAASPGPPGSSECEALFVAAYERARHLACVLTPEGAVRHANRAACAFVGCDPVSVVGSPFWETPWWAHSADERAKVREAVARASAGETIELEATTRGADGSLCPLEVALRPAQDAQGRLFALIFEGWDITQRRRAEDLADRTRLLLEAVIEQSPVAITVVTIPDLVVRYYNRAVVETLGLQGEGNFVGRTLPQVFEEQSWRDFRADGTPAPPAELPLARALRGVATRGEELRVLRKDGTYAWELASATPIRDHREQLMAAVLVLTDVTERKRTLERLSRLADEQRTVLDTVTIGVCHFQGRRLHWANPAFLSLLGYRMDEVLDVDAATFYSSTDDYERVLAAGYPLLTDGRTYSTELAMRRKDGGLLWCVVSGRAIDPKDVDAGTIWALQDTTTRRAAEDEVRRSQVMLEEAQLQAKIGSWELDPTSETGYWSEEMFRLLDLDPARGRPALSEFLAIIHPADRGLLPEAERRAVDTDETVSVQVRGDPSRLPGRFLVSTIKAVKDASGQLRRVAGTLQDVTARVQAEAAAREGQERLALALRGADLGSWDWDVPTGAVRYDERWAQMLGYGSDEIEPHLRGWERLVHPDDMPHVRAILEAHVSGQTSSYEVEHRLRHKSGSWVWVLSRGKVIARDQTERPLRAVGTHLDISERKRAEETLRENARRFERLVENSSDITAVADSEGWLLSVSGPVSSILGIEPEQLVGRCIFDSIHPEDTAAARAVFAQAVATPGTTRRFEGRLPHSNGNWVPTEMAGTSWLHDPLIRGVVLNTRDISDRKNAESARARLQDHLQQAAKMEAVGRLAGGIAHDFNNLLTVILGFVALAGPMDGLPDGLKRYLEGIGRAAGKAADLTRQLLAFSRRQILQTHVVSLNDLVDNLRPMLVRLIGEDVKLQTILDGNLEATRVDPGQADQVLLNLAVNARDAMPNGGSLTIETANAHLDESYCQSHADVRPGDYVLLAVSDTGMGMDDAVKRRLFEPFFTTKPRGQGTGLGLAVSFGIVKQAGGSIEVYSEVGRGTTFKIYLPMVTEEPQAISKPPIDPEPPRGTETILLVEDDASVRELAATLLEHLGYDVLVAPDGPSALALAEHHASPIALLLTDVVMPDMNGRELAERVAIRHAETRVLYTSGYTEDVAVLHGVLEDHLSFMGKPFSTQSLASKVRQVLDAPASGDEAASRNRT